LYSHAFNRQDWQQGELEIVQPVTFPERNLERIVEATRSHTRLPNTVVFPAAVTLQFKVIFRQHDRGGWLRQFTR
jgi:hypothetical protein